MPHANPTVAKEYRRNYYIKNRERILTARRDYVKNNKEIADACTKNSRLKNIDKARARQKAYNEKNRERKAEVGRRYYQKNKELISAKKKMWAEANRHKVIASNKRRKHMQSRACPSWLNAQQKKDIEYMYFLAKTMTEQTGIPHHVDHIIPLNGKTVCGLHVPWNLQPMEASANIRKGNRVYELHELESLSRGATIH